MEKYEYALIRDFSKKTFLNDFKSLRCFCEYASEEIYNYLVENDFIRSVKNHMFKIELYEVLQLFSQLGFEIKTISSIVNSNNETVSDYHLQRKIS